MRAYVFTPSVLKFYYIFQSLKESHCSTRTLCDKDSSINTLQESDIFDISHDEDYLPSPPTSNASCDEQQGASSGIFEMERQSDNPAADNSEADNTVRRNKKRSKKSVEF